MPYPSDAATPPLSPNNPFMQGEGIPAFDRMTAADVVPAVRALIARQDAGVLALEARLSAGLVPTWDSVFVPLSELGEPLSFAWGAVHHLLGVRNTPELREAEEAVQPEVISSSLRVGQSRPLYAAYKAIAASSAWSSLTEAQRRIIQSSIEGAELSGVGLDGAQKERFNQIQVELGDAGTKFENHLLDATKAFALVLTSADEVDGLPDSVRGAAAQSAREGAEEDQKAGRVTAALAAEMATATPEAGPWRVGLDAALFVPFMEHGRRRDIRERLYRTYVTRASSGELDNGPLVATLLRLRQEEALLLGYKSFAELSLKRKMAERVENVDALLGDLRRASRPFAERELAELQTFAATTGKNTEPLQLWDIAFWAERLREARYDFSEEALRPYLPLPTVLQGLFALAGKLFGVSFKAASGEVPVWNPDVQYFRVFDESGAERASFLLDSYSRPADKRGGAWVSGCVERKRRADGSVRLPVAYICCNQLPPVDGKPSLMTFSEVETLFHEFGHALQHMLTTVDYPEAAGTNNIEWDAVELPSQFMENWCYHRPTLMGFAKHFQTGESLPTELFEKISAARTFRAGSQFLRQIYFATLDLELHHRFDPAKDDAVAVQARIAAENTILRPLPEDRFLCGFSHIFAGGYSAGYFSYKWAEVLSADAFGAFEEAGLDNPPALAKVGRHFRDTVLALGGGRHPAEVFKDFRGRAPSAEALLRHNGLIAVAA